MLTITSLPWKANCPGVGSESGSSPGSHLRQYPFPLETLGLGRMRPQTTFVHYLALCTSAWVGQGYRGAVERERSQRRGWGRIRQIFS